MLGFLIYDAKVAVLIAIFYMFYRLMLARETFHRVNRLMLLLTAVASFVLPLCVITMHETVMVEPLPVMAADDLSMKYVAPTAEPVAETPLWQIVLPIIFIIGMVATLAHSLMSMFRILMLIKRSEKYPQPDGTTICVSGNAKVPPFSWMHYIVLNRDDYAEQNAAILAHERGHIRLRHSWDLLLVDTLTALQWFNPAMWMLRSDLRAIHEYEADGAVLSLGINARQYQYLLITKAASIGGYSLANGINHSTLKNRINMMLHKKSQTSHLLKLLALIPIVGIALAVNAKKVQDVVYTEAPEATSNEEMIAETQPEAMAVAESNAISFRVVFWPENAPIEGVPVEVIDRGKTILKTETTDKGVVSVNAPIGSTVRFTLIDKVKDVKITKELAAKGGLQTVAFGDGSENFEDKPITVQGIVYDEASTPIVGAAIQIVGTKKGTVTDFDGKFKLDASTGDALLFSYVGYDPEQIGVAQLTADKKGCIVHLKKTDTGKVYDVVEQMPQFPGGHGALFEYITKSLKYPAEAEKAGTQGRVIATFVVEKDGSITNAKVVKSIDPLLDAEALRIINEMPKWTSGKQNGELMRVKYTVPITFRLQGNESQEYKVSLRYNDESKATNQFETVVVGYGDKAQSDKEPYVIVDGKPIDGAKLKEINPQTIDHMEVLKSQEAVKKYGDKAKNGVIVVTTKK